MTEPTQNIEEITEDIGAYYPVIKQRKRLKETYKKVIQEKYDKMDAEEELLRGKVIEGMLLHYQKRTNWSWLPSFYDLLEDQAKLPLAVKIDKKTEERFKVKNEDPSIDNEFVSITSLQSEPSKSLKLTAKRATPAQKEAEAQEDDELTRELQGKDLEELVLLYQANQHELKELEEQYETDRETLLAYLLEEKADSISSPVGKFSVSSKKGDYDTASFFSETLYKEFQFAFRPLDNDGTVVCIDLLTKEEPFEFQHETNYQGSTLSYKKGRLWVDGVRLQTDIRDLFEGEDGALKATGFVEVDPMILFRHCPLSSTKINEMVDKAQLEPKVMEAHRTITNIKDTSLYFEIIDEEADKDRKFFFQQRMKRRGQSFRRKWESTDSLSQEELDAVLQSLDTDKAATP